MKKPKIVKRLVMLVASFGYLCVRAVARLVNPADADRVVVLTYHSVDSGEMTQFEWQMRQVGRRTRPVFADQAAADVVGRAVAITFDDAFQNVFDWALPLLARYEIPATIFVPTGYLGLGPAWITGRAAGAVPGRVVSIDTLTTVDHSRVRLGSHTVSHPRLATLDGPRVDYELGTSKAVLERISGCRIDMLALPYGSWAPSISEAAKRAGYTRVFANVPISGRGGHYPILVGRVDVSPGDWRCEFLLKLRGAYEWMAVAVPTKRAVLTFFGRADVA